jgi:hypothetical protein
VFDSIMVRRAVPANNRGPLDLGHLAEAMLFYQHVQLVLTRFNMPQLIRQCGPDLAIELVENTNVDAIRIDVALVVTTIDQGAASERYWPPLGVKVAPPRRTIPLPPEGLQPSDETLRLPDEAMVIKALSRGDW